MSMLATNRLLSLSVSDVTGSDLVRIFAQNYGQDAGLSLANLKAYLDSVSDALTDLTQEIQSPPSGSTVTMADGEAWLILGPLSTLATLTIVLPPSPSNGAEVLVNSTQQITSLTVSSTTAAVVSAPISLATTNNDSWFRMKYSETLNAWYRVG